MSVTTTDAARALVRRRWDRPEAVARRTAALEDRIRAYVESAPPLPAEAAERLAGILLAHREGGEPT